MIMEKFNQFSTLQAVTAAAVSTDVVDLGATYDFGAGEPIWAVFRVGTAADSSGDAATVNFEIEGSTDAAFTSPITLAETGAVAQAALTANTTVAKLRLASTTPIRYMRARYNVAVANLTAGTFDAFLVKDIDNYHAYANGYTVL
jgi:hypothetical protein